MNATRELQIRTPFAMNGYLDEPELTRAAFADGYFRTGDLARAREDGRVELAGRIKDIIIRGGANVSPLELDHLLAQHPDVAAALTAGVPDPMVDERIHTLIVPRANASIGEKDLRQWVAARVEKFKCPTFTISPRSCRPGALERSTEARCAIRCCGNGQRRKVRARCNHVG